MSPAVVQGADGGLQDALHGGLLPLPFHTHHGPPHPAELQVSSCSSSSYSSSSSSPPIHHIIILLLLLILILLVLLLRSLHVLLLHQQVWQQAGNPRLQPEEAGRSKQHLILLFCLSPSCLSSLMLRSQFYQCVATLIYITKHTFLPGSSC